MWDVMPLSVCFLGLAVGYPVIMLIVSAVKSVRTRHREQIDELVVRARSGDYGAVRIGIKTPWVLGSAFDRILHAYYYEDGWQINNRLTQARLEGLEGGTDLAAKSKTQHDPLILKQLTKQLKRGEKSRAMMWLDAPVAKVQRPINVVHTKLNLPEGVIDYFNRPPVDYIK